MSATLDWAEHAARAFEPTVPRPRRWATPGEMARDLDPTTRQTPALDLIDRALLGVLDGRTKKLILATSPQIGKSQRVSRRLPLYALLDNPKLRIAVVSANLTLAEKWGRAVRDDIAAHPELGVTLRRDSNSAKRWETTAGGSLFCTGWTSGTIGQPIDLLIIDDPITSRQEAESDVVRQRLWEFWENDAGTRARRTIVMATRWHVDDLSGQLLKKEPGKWTELSIPAVSEGEGDPLGRPEGVELESANPELHPPGYFLDKQATTSPYVWNSLYQQRPTAAAGNLFKRGDWRYWTPGADRRLNLDGNVYDLAGCMRFITIDLATSLKTSADFTVASAWAITLAGDLVLLDRVRQRVEQAGHFELVTPLRQRWLGPYDVVHVESRQFGTTFVYQAGRAGLPIAELEADVDKLTRALPAANLVTQHRIWLPADAPWLDVWLDEHADFPKVTHDDQVDTTGYAARVALTRWLPPQTAAEEQARRAPADPDEIDLMTAAW